jgi:tetratricopeptide (TPR) repeat protein
MSTTLNLADCVLSRGRTLQELGRHADALRLLSRLSSWRQLSADVAEEAQARLADICLRREHFAQARRHLAAVLAHRPDNARYHYQLARAIDSDEKGDVLAALKHYRRSLELDPDQPSCLSDFGLVALRVGKREEGLRALRRAVELAPDDPAIMRKLLSGLRQSGQLAEARVALRAALFRNPRSSAFHKLWNEFRFEQARQAQQAACHNGAAGLEADERLLLPFLRPADGVGQPERDRKRIRRHGESPFPSPHMPHTARLSHQRPA